MTASFAAARGPRRHRALTPDQIGGWLRFLRHAEKAARDPEGHGASFARAAHRAGKQPLPAGQNNNGAGLIALIRLGKAFATQSPDRRRDAARDIPRLVEECRPLFQTPAVTGVRSVEPRKDIFG
ncbi:hypothetical protein [Brevundimonas nasdae]|uniref:hypothetical protein n=1 Tax=Brevundimonas nasdae TaxID=172043 RepID=UPI003F690D6C